MAAGRLLTHTLCLFLLSSLSVGAAGAFHQGAPHDGELLIAVLDSGIDPDHVEFTACSDHPLEDGSGTYRWKDLVAAEATPLDSGGHGTAVSSVAIGKTVGESPCTELMVGRVCDASGCFTSDIAAGIRWALDEGADIINLSLGSQVPVPGLLTGLDDELATARDEGVLVVVSAGNGVGNFGLVPDPSFLGQPSGSHEALVVGASDEAGNPAIGFSSDPEVIQAGVNVKAAQAGTTDGYIRIGGTSFSAPNVAGIAAEVQKAWNTEHGTYLSVDDLETFLKWTAENHPSIPPTFEGWGYVSPNVVDRVADGFPDAPQCPQTDPLVVGLNALGSCPEILHDEAVNGVRGVW